MRGHGVTFLALVVGSALLTSWVPVGSDPVDREPRAEAAVSRSAGKGDRLATYAQPLLRSVASVETRGPASAPNVVMRDRDGDVVFAASQEAAIATVTKGVEIAPPIRRTDADGTKVAKLGQRARVPVGCDRILSALVRSAYASQISRCLT